MASLKLVAKKGTDKDEAFKKLVAFAKSQGMTAKITTGGPAGESGTTLELS